MWCAVNEGLSISSEQLEYVIDNAYAGLTQKDLGHILARILVN